MPPMATVDTFSSMAERVLRMSFVPTVPMIDFVFSLLLEYKLLTGISERRNGEVLTLVLRTLYRCQGSLHPPWLRLGLLGSRKRSHR